jgi:abortive infection bacteriophage resistance protein
MGRPYSKPALTFEQQLAQLESRGMLVPHREDALGALKRISYYRLSAYWHLFKRADNSFEPGTTFEQALELYEFDRRLRLTVLDAIERVEVFARTLVTYTLGHSGGAFAYTNAATFESRFNHGAWLADLTKEIERAREKFLEHFATTYDGFPIVPIWMASEVMSLGTLSKMFKGMQAKDQQVVATEWGVHRIVAESWMHSLSYVRNVCAHHGRLWNRELAIKPVLPKNRQEWSAVSNRRIYSVLCLLRQITKPVPGGSGWSNQVIALLSEMNGKPRWTNAMGLPRDWATQAFWK